MDAPLARRLASLAYEATLWSALVLVVGFLTLPLVSAAPSGLGGLRSPDLPARVVTLVLVFGGAALYYVWCWTGGRRTLPMKTWRLRLVRADGARLDKGTALVRYLAAWTGPVVALLAYAVLRRWDLGAHALWLIALNYLWALVDPERRFLHDRLAATRIVVDGLPARGAPAVRSAASD